MLLIETFLSGGGDHSSLIELRLLQHRWEVRLKHISRVQNEITDHMVKCVIPGDPLCQLFAEPPNSVVGLLARDHNGFRSF